MLQKLSSTQAFLGLTVLMHFPISFNAQNTHVISTGHLLDH